MRPFFFSGETDALAGLVEGRVMQVSSRFNRGSTSLRIILLLFQRFPARHGAENQDTGPVICGKRKALDFSGI
jgi:hypothetical protein